MLFLLCLFGIIVDVIKRVNVLYLTFLFLTLLFTYSENLFYDHKMSRTLFL